MIAAPTPAVRTALCCTAYGCGAVVGPSGCDEHPDAEPAATTLYSHAEPPLAAADLTADHIAKVSAWIEGSAARGWLNTTEQEVQRALEAGDAGRARVTAAWNALNRRAAS